VRMMASKPWICIMGDTTHEVYLDRAPQVLSGGGLVDDPACHIQQWQHRDGKWDLLTVHDCDQHHHIVIWPDAIMRAKLHEG